MQKKQRMKNLLKAAAVLLAVTFFSCKDNSLDKFDLYGLYETSDTEQFIQSINFSEPYVLVRYSDLTEDRFSNYQIIDNDVFSDSSVLIYQIINFKKNESMELYHVDSMINLVF